MNEFTYQDQVDRVLDYKKKILDSHIELLNLLEKYEKNIPVHNIKSLLDSTKLDSKKSSLKNEIRKQVQKILTYLSSMGTFSNLDIKKLENILHSINEVTESSLEQNPELGAGVIRLFFGDINSIVFKVEEKHPYSVKIDFNFLTGLLSGKYERK